MAREFCLSIELGFRSHAKTRKFCRLMGQNAMAFGHLIALWEWAVEQAPSGDLSTIDIEEIEDGMGHLASDGRCYAALVASGFIDELPGGRREIHNWMKPGRTGFALARMEAERRRWRRAKGIPETGFPAGVPEDSSRNPAGTTEESDGIPSSSRFTVHGSKEPPPAGVPARSDEPDADTQASPLTGLWDAFDWSTKFKLAWCAKYNTHAYGQGTRDAKATGDLLGILGELTPGDRLAAQARAGAMFTEYLADPVPGRGTNRHPWIWFVERFNGLRVPAQAARGSPGKPPPRTDADRRKNALPPPPKEWTDGWNKNQQT